MFLAIRQTTNNQLTVRIMHVSSLFQLVFAVPRLLSQNVTLVCLAPLNLSRREDLEAFRGSALGLNFWHKFPFVIVTGRFPLRNILKPAQLEPRTAQIDLENEDYHLAALETSEI